MNIVLFLLIGLVAEPLRGGLSAAMVMACSAISSSESSAPFLIGDFHHVLMRSVS